MKDEKRACPACGRRHTLNEPCDHAVRCRVCGLAIRREDGRNICNKCEQRERSK